MTRSARVPPIESAEEAARAVRHARFPPRGARSGGGVRPLHDFATYRATAQQTVVIPMIETVAGVANAASIAAVADIDMIFVGPGDLALSLGVDPGAPAHAQACDQERNTQHRAHDEEQVPHARRRCHGVADDEPGEQQDGRLDQERTGDVGEALAIRAIARHHQQQAHHGDRLGAAEQPCQQQSTDEVRHRPPRRPGGGRARPPPTQPRWPARPRGR